MDAMTYDYTLSEEELLPEKESRMVEIREVGLTDEFAGTPKDWIPKMHEYLVQNYGGTRRYLEEIGIDEETQLRIIEILRG